MTHLLRRVFAQALSRKRRRPTNQNKQQMSQRIIEDLHALAKESYFLYSKILALKCQKQKHSKNIVLLWPCGHKDQSFLAFWYKSKQEIFKGVKIQMKKNNFVLNLCRCLSDSLLHSLSNSIWHCWKRFQQQIWIL